MAPDGGTVRYALAAALALALSACSPGAGDDAGPDATDGDTYSAGMSKDGDAVRVVLVSASPAPPDVGNNRWTLRVTDHDDQPLDDVTVLVSPFMPEHQHGTSPPDYEAASTGAAGEGEAGPFDLFMPGMWEIKVGVSDDSGLDDDVVFRFDIEG
jgi:hypothetical protein